MAKNLKVKLEEAPNFRCICSTCIESGVLDDNQKIIDCDLFGQLYLKNKKRWCPEHYRIHLGRFGKNGYLHEGDAQIAVKWHGKYLLDKIKALKD